jgi:hypothetical protein
MRRCKMGPKMWRTVILSVGVLVVAVAAGTAVFAAMDDGGEAPGNQPTIDAPAGGTCLEDATDCADDPSAGGAAGGTCLEGATECADDPSVGAVGGTCLVGTTECNDTPDIAGGG